MVLILLTGCFTPNNQPGTSTNLGAQGSSGNQSVTDSKTESEIHKETITLTAAGDILMHNTLIWSGQQPSGSYQFSFFSEVQPILEQGDYVTASLETALAGPATGYTGYPEFNSPDAIAQHLKDSGVDGVVTANNHIMDRGYSGALRTLEVLRGSGLDTLGVNKNADEAQQLLIQEIRGVKVGYLSYTYGTNGISVPKEHPYFINLLDKEKILKDISRMRPQVDVLILILHWGVEYSPEPTDEQRSLARQFLEAGADAIIGSHPHVIQAMEVLKIDGKDKFVAYSLGNFIGDQRGDERNSGVIVQLKFTQETEVFQGDASSERTLKKNTLEEVRVIPTYSHSYREKGKQGFRVVPVEETLRKISTNEEKILSEKDVPALESVLKATQERLSFTGFSK